MSSRVKYPRTPHLPWSPGATSDDVLLLDTEHLAGREVVVTEKMDGENTTMYSDHIHARSVDSRHHPSRAWVKSLQGRVGHLIPEGWRVCGENMYAEHSIRYESLKSYFYVFSIWDNENVCLHWDDTLEWCRLLGLVSVPVLYRGVWNENRIRELGDELNLEKQEGYVVRGVESFVFEDFRSQIAKWVRRNHVQTDEHWMHKEIVPNALEGP